MEKDKEKSSRKHRDSDHYDREKVRESVKDSKDRDHHRHHRNSKEKSRDVDEEVHRHRSDRRSVREYSIEREKSVDYSRNEREGSRDRHKREKSHDREDSVERRHSKRKERGQSEEDGYVDGGTKRARVVEERRGRKRFEEEADENGRGEENKEKRRFEDAGEDKDSREERKRRFDDSTRDKVNREERNEKRKFEDRVKKEEGGEAEKERAEARTFKKEPKEEPVHDSFGDVNRGGSSVHVGALEPTTASRTSIDVSLSENRSPATKVSLISNTNENKGVNSNRSHEVPGKSGTDGTGSDAGKKESALSKAQKAVQKQKELTEKIKKFQLLKKGGSIKEGGPRLAGKEELKTPSTNSGLLPPPAPSGSSSSGTSVNTPQSGLPHLAGLTTQKYEAVKRAQELAAKMGFRQDPEFAPLINMFPGQLQPEVSVQPKPAKAPVLRLDALGREIDESGNVVNIPKVNNLSTLKVNINKQKKDAFQILKPELEVDPEKNPHFDARMGIDKDKLLRPKRMNFQFVEEGKWSKDAEMIKLKSRFGEDRTKEIKAKQAQLAKAKSEPNINPNLIEVSERVSTKEKPKEQIPEIEWWDVPFLLSGNYSGVTDGNITEEKLKLEKISIYVEHPRPIEPPAEPVPPPPQPLKLTKKEQKKLRTQRRLAREKDKQEMIRQGLIEPPKPKVKMSNLMRVLGSEATQDPTKLEMEIRSAAADREQNHHDRNIARKLTPAERREKKERKLFDDSSNPEAIVSVYKINNLSHPQNRFKVDANAHENRLTGSAVISEGISVVVVEGCPKSIKRYKNLMLRRIDWAADVKKEEEDDGDDAHDAPVNKCLLVWQGNVAKPNFNRFSVHECRTEAAARKIFSDAGVAHYWELAVNFTEDQM